MKTIELGRNLVAIFPKEYCLEQKIRKGTPLDFSINSDGSITIRKQTPKEGV